MVDKNNCSKKDIFRVAIMTYLFDNMMFGEFFLANDHVNLTNIQVSR